MNKTFNIKMEKKVLSEVRGRDVPPRDVLLHHFLFYTFFPQNKRRFFESIFKTKIRAFFLVEAILPRVNVPQEEGIDVPPVFSEAPRTSSVGQGLGIHQVVLRHRGQREVLSIVDRVKCCELAAASRTAAALGDARLYVAFRAFF